MSDMHITAHVHPVQVRGYTTVERQHSRSKAASPGGSYSIREEGITSGTCPLFLLWHLSSASSLQLHAREESSGYSMAVVAQLCSVHRAGFLGVDDGGALEVLQPMARLELQLCLVVAPCTVWYSHDGLSAVLETLTYRLQVHILDEVAV